MTDTDQILLSHVRETMKCFRFQTADDARRHYHNRVKHWPWASVNHMIAWVEPRVSSAMENDGMPFEPVFYNG